MCARAVEVGEAPLPQEVIIYGFIYECAFPSPYFVSLTDPSPAFATANSAASAYRMDPMEVSSKSRPRRARSSFVASSGIIEVIFTVTKFFGLEGSSGQYTDAMQVVAVSL